MVEDVPSTQSRLPSSLEVKGDVPETGMLIALPSLGAPTLVKPTLGPPI